MRYETTADIFSANELIRTRLLATMETIGQDGSLRAGGEGWSIAEIVEHLSIVEGGILRICTRLLEAAKAAGKPGDGRVYLSADFNNKAISAADVKIEAPERVRPTGEQNIEDSIAKLQQYRAGFNSL